MSMLDKFRKGKAKEGNGSGIAPIPGARGSQMTIEAKLGKKNYFSAYLDVARLPDCEQKTAYLKYIIKGCMENGFFHSAIDPVLLLPDKDEAVRWLEAILGKCREAKRGDWIMDILKQFPKCDKLPVLLEKSIIWFLENHGWKYANEAAGLNGRELTALEAEAFIADNLVEAMHLALAAAKQLNRELTAAELMKVINAEQASGNYWRVFQIATGLPDGPEKSGFFKTALSDAIKNGNPTNARAVASALGRELANDELREIFTADNNSRYAYLLAKDKMNFPFLEEAAERFRKKGEYRMAVEMFELLPDNDKKQSVLESIGLKAERVKNYQFVKKVACLLKEGEVKSRLQLFLVRQSFEKYRDILIWEDSIKAILEDVKALAMVPEKLEFLEILFEACQMLEEEDHDERGCRQVTYEVEKLLNEFG